MVKKVKNFFQKNALLISSILFMILFAGVMQIFAAAPAGGYAPGATLNPDCAPGDGDCIVNIEATDIDYDNTISVLTATNVQNAIDELDGVVDGINGFTIDANNNMFAGTDSGSVLTTGNKNFFAGIETGRVNTTGYFNTASGYQSFYSNTTGRWNTAYGYQALYSNLSSTRNTGVGYLSLYANTTGNTNTAIGAQALTSNTTGSQNSAIGVFALQFNTGGIGNTALGYQALYLNTLGVDNTASGTQALYSNTTGYWNSAYGIYSLYSNTTGAKNTAYGTYAGYTTNGDNGVYLGNYAGAYEVGGDVFYVDNQDRLNTAGDKAGALMYGTFNATPATQTLRINANVGIGVAPTNILHVTGVPAAGTPVARIANTLGGTTQNNGLIILAGNDTGVAASEMITFRRPDNTIIGSISQDAATTVAYNLTSDRRIKENISNTDFGLEDLMNIDVVDFNFTSDSNQKKMTGFIAQDLYNIFPGAVTPNGDNGIDLLSVGKTPWMVDYSKLSPLIVKAIQDLDLKVESLADINSLLIDEEGNKTFVGRFFDRITAWLGNATNGIEKIFTKEISTENLCIKKSDGTEVCITGDQLDQLLSTAGTSGSSSSESSGGTPEIIPDPVPAPTEETCSDNIQNQDETGIDTGGVCESALIPEEETPTPEPTPEPAPME